MAALCDNDYFVEVHAGVTFPSCDDFHVFQLKEFILVACEIECEW